MNVTLPLDEAERLTTRALMKNRTSEANARLTAQALVAAEVDGQSGHGLTRVPSYAEQARVVIRHIRRDGMDLLKKLEKDGHISQDDGRAKSDLVQKATDAAIAEVDQVLAAKEQEIMQV